MKTGKGSRFLVLTAGLFLLIQSNLLAGEEEEKSEAISSEDFMRSAAADFFQSGDYGRALKAFAPLIEQYPRDLLLKRYVAMTLDRMGRSGEAIQIFKELLQESPDHIPTKFFLGQAYERKREKDLAIREWQQITEVKEADPYGQWALEGLARLGVAAPPAPRKRPRLKRWTVAGRYGYEYDSNVILRPEDKTLASGRDQDAGRHTFDAILRYRAFSRRDLAVDLIYTSRQSLHEDSLNEFNFTSQEFGLNARKRLQVLNRDVVFGARYDLLAGFLDGGTFSLRNRWTLTADSRLTDRTRTVFSHQLTAAEFGPDGSNPPQTSRDGLYNDLGMTQYFYTKDFRRYLSVEEEFNRADTRGGNFELRGQTTRIGLHTPFLPKTDLDVSGAFRYGKYPRFSSLSSLDTDRRRDMEWDLYFSLTNHLTERVDFRVFYRLIVSENRNGFFDYDRHIGGAQIIFREAF